MAVNKRKVLIIAGERLVARKMEELLRGMGLDTEEALYADDGMLLAELEQPSLVIIDVSSERFDGFSLFKTLRESHHTAHIPVILLTSERFRGGIYSPEDFEAAFDVRSPEGMLEQPVDHRFLAASVLGVLG
ncbi:MAG: response regulator [Candidatus Hydrogenedens sp.]|nr:response regulator [Candidatus Hydrogenedentota bacterium]NLF58117.1 response regulator [Candidatus Hydrogenedens sp.]